MHRERAWIGNGHATAQASAAPAPHRVIERDGEQILFTSRRYNGDELRLTVSYFEGKPVVQLRDWYEAEPRQWRPGKKGISLPVRELAAIASALDVALQRISGRPSDEEDPL